MDTRQYFKQQTIPLDESNSNGFIDSTILLGLVKNEELKQLLIDKYELTENIKITLDSVDVIFQVVKKLDTLDKDAFYIKTVVLEKAESSRYLNQYLTETIKYAMNISTFS